MNRSIATVGLMLLAATSTFSQEGGAPRLRAGAHKVDFTPKESDLRIPTDSIRDRLFARAIVVDDGRTCAVLVGIDLGAAGNQIVDDAIARASST
jgi:neutral ceramidase